MRAIELGRASLLATAAIISFGSELCAKERGFSNYDGDTFNATFRIANIDTPEIKGQCASERALALRAKEFTQTFLKGGHVEIHQTGIDKYGRILATIRRGDQDLGDALIAEGLARPWRGKREQWCNAK